MASDPAQTLIRTARKARSRARAQYSGFKVGAALRTNGRKIYSGCNIENASYGLTVCAERVVLLNALSDGARKFRSLAVVTGADKVTPPCGACRQLLWEYCGDIVVHLANLKGKTRTFRLTELLPHAFDKRHLYVLEPRGPQPPPKASAGPAEVNWSMN